MRSQMITEAGAEAGTERSTVAAGLCQSNTGPWQPMKEAEAEEQNSRTDVKTQRIGKQEGHYSSPASYLSSSCLLNNITIAHASAPKELLLRYATENQSIIHYLLFIIHYPLYSIHYQFYPNLNLQRTYKPSNQVTKQPSNQATKQPSNQATKRKQNKNCKNYPLSNIHYPLYTPKFKFVIEYTVSDLLSNIEHGQHPV